MSPSRHDLTNLPRVHIQLHKTYSDLSIVDIASSPADNNSPPSPPTHNATTRRNTPTMRRGLLIFILVNLLILTLLVRSVSTLLSLLVEDAAADAIHRAELPSPNSSLIETRPQIIPKIIHQTYKNETIPEVWREAQQSCIDLHPDYEYIVRGNQFPHGGLKPRFTRECRVANSRAAVD